MVASLDVRRTAAAPDARYPARKRASPHKA